MALSRAQLAVVQSHMLKVPDLVSRLDTDNLGFPESVLKWLEEMVFILKALRLGVVSKVAVERATLADVIAGRLPGDTHYKGKPTHRKTVRTAAIEAVGKAVDLVNQAIDPRTDEFTTAETIARQIATILVEKERPPLPTAGWERKAAIEKIIKDAEKDEEVLRGLLHLKSIVGPHDMRVLIAEAFEQQSA